MTTADCIFYDKPIDVMLELKPGEAGVVPPGNDVFIVKHICGKRYDAMVPTWAVGEDLLTVVAARVASIGDDEMLYFPVSNEGRPAWIVPKAELQGMVLKTATH